MADTKTARSASSAPPEAPPPSAHGTRRGVSWGRIAAWAALVLLIVVTLFPFWWMLRTALSTNAALFQQPASPLPVDGTWVNFRRVLGLASPEEIAAAGGTGAEIDFFRALWNSVVVATLITVGQVTSCAMAAYAFARMRFRGRDTLFFIFLTALMVPPVFTMIPNFVLIQNLGWLNTYRGIVAPFFLFFPFAVFFLRQFFIGISKEVEEAALLDGASRWAIFYRIAIPMSAAPLATLAILTYVQSWNEYMWPLIVGQDESVRVMTVALSVFRASTPQAAPDWTGLMAATFLAALPIIILFLFLARRMVDAIQFSGIK